MKHLASVILIAYVIAMSACSTSNITSGLSKEVVKSQMAAIPIPPEPIWDPVLWEKGCRVQDNKTLVCDLYCITDTNAKNLLKNHEREKAYIKELQDLVSTLNQLHSTK